MSSDPPQGSWQPPSGGGAYEPAPPPGGGYDAPPAAAQAGTPGKAIASLILGIVGILFCPLICSTLALIFGYQARREIQGQPGREGGGLATAGIVLGWVGIAFAVLLVALFAAGAISS